jgi:hypothetical protein
MDNDRKPILMDDVGTRLDHLAHLRDNWELAVEVLEKRFAYLCTPELATLTKLRNALELLDEHIVKDFNPWEYARTINLLPPADRIEGGRGTETKR